ncbi:ABC transporter ATP-binding protein [Sphaerisporangium sp. TRM90804]|uniref:ABC transporter ATP-binding protein n=1 Tax=Sphaerisporangium sp. TRM90804 TaxID=3031113 RepID=UPI002447AB8D|nr:ABC transporter ATP-binding protein [Sphaerisporangium sp. TRM90804]MDH2430625.1 ABC transporter ATP-binding protein [Sphaerisporangium sp. TRM90804]
MTNRPLRDAAMPVIEIVHLGKRYRDVAAVDDVTLQVRAGQIYALLGLNGAGKTTLIRLLLGMIAPTAGTVRVLGAAVSAGDRAAWGRVGYLVEAAAAYPELTVRENLDVARRLRRLPGTSDDVIERLALTPYAERRARTLSLGNLQRLALARALLHTPALLVLDEPVNGLDPAGVAEIRALLADLAHQHGTTVFLSSHLLAEVARLATRIGIMHDGRLVGEHDAGQLDRHRRRHLRLATHDDAAAHAVLRAHGYHPEPATPAGLLLTDERALAQPERVATALVHGGVPPTDLHLQEEDLEAFFLRTVGSSRKTGPEAGTGTYPGTGTGAGDA